MPIQHNIAIIGASGYIGQNLLNHLSDQKDVRIKALIHKNELAHALTKKGIETCQGDLMKSDTLERFISPGDTVMNLVYLKSSRQDNLTAINNLLAACERKKVKRLIHCSTARVSGRTHENPVSETTTCKPISEYAATKLAIEDAIQKKSNSYEVIILRPTAVFGPGGVNLVQFVHQIGNQSRIRNYVKSCLMGYSRHNYVYVDNVVSAMVFLLDIELKRRQETFIISDDDALLNNYRNLERYFKNYFGWKDYTFPPVHLPLPILTFLADSMNKSDNPATIFSCQKLLEAGFKKPVSFEDGLSRFAEWYKAEYL
jgi:nucleoside-diphosphate-sugar epimerase